MKKIILKIIRILRGFVLNPFWKSKLNIILFVLTLAISAVLWYIYATRIHNNLNYFIFASGLIIINTILANYLYSKDELLSLILLSAAFFSQVIILAFINFLLISL